jgi:hypothetical protein
MLKKRTWSGGVLQREIVAASNNGIEIVFDGKSVMVCQFVMVLSIYLLDTVYKNIFDDFLYHLFFAIKSINVIE